MNIDIVKACGVEYKAACQNVAAFTVRYFERIRCMTEFEFDKESADRIEKVVQGHALCLRNCADILELLAPLCDMWTPKGLQNRIQRAFSEYLSMAKVEMPERITMYNNARQTIANEVSQFLQDAGFEDASKAVDCEFEL